MSMGLIRRIKLNFLFFTKIPVKVEVKSYDEIAETLWLSPLVGWILGIICSGISLIFFNFLPDLLVGFLILGIITFLTGAHHLDGLLDFGDGLMFQGNAEKKIDVMHDVSIGAGGFSLGLFILISTGITIAFLKNNIILALTISEICAKNAIVIACSLGKSANTKMATPFIEKNSPKQLVHALITSCLFVFLTIVINTIYTLIFSNIAELSIIIIPVDEVQIWDYKCVIFLFVIFFLSSIIPSLLIIRIANKNFNGLTGDCLGALNEITRLFSLIFFLFFSSLTLI